MHGLSIVMDTEKDRFMVQALLDFKAKLDVLVMEAFAKDSSMISTLKDGFQHFVNRRENKPAEVKCFIHSKEFSISI